MGINLSIWKYYYIQINFDEIDRQMEPKQSYWELMGLQSFKKI